MRRLAAAWRLRSTEREHLPSIVVCGGLGVAVSAMAGRAFGPVGAIVGAGLLVSIWLWGIWDEGGRILRDQAWTPR